MTRLGEVKIGDRVFDGNTGNDITPTTSRAQKVQAALVAEHKKQILATDPLLTSPALKAAKTGAEIAWRNASSDKSSLTADHPQAIAKADAKVVLAKKNTENS